MMHDNQDQAAHGTPPDQGAQGDVSTTGHSSHDAQDTHSGQDAHGGGGHGGHGGDDAPDISTLVPTTWKQLVFPSLIMLLVAILVSGPVFSAFASRPATPPNTGESTGNTGNTGTSEGTGGTITESTATIAATPGSQQEVSTTSTVVTAPSSAPQTTSTAQVSAPLSNVAATRTAVAVDGESGTVARVPVELEFAKTTYVVKAGSNLLPDWKPSQDVGIATWIEGTFANHILYLPYSDQNAALFKAARNGDTMKITMNTGQVFVFSVTRSQRAVNGPATAEGEFTVTTAMRQDHAGVTLFLIGDPAADRAVVQADFTGAIQ